MAKQKVEEEDIAREKAIQDEIQREKDEQQRKKQDDNGGALAGARVRFSPVVKERPKMKSPPRN